MLNPTWISGREENGRRIYFKIKSPLKYGTRPRSNSQPLYLQSDLHLQSDTLSSALRDPLKVLSHEMNVSSGVSKVNSIYVYIRPKHFLFSVTLTTLIFWGLLIMPPKELWEAYSNRTVRLSVRPSVRLSVRPASCPVYISFNLWGRNSNFGMWIYLGMAECRVPFMYHCDIELDIWPSF